MKLYDLKHILSLDLRALAAFRISLGLLLICDQLVRFEDLAAHYSDLGVMPRDCICSSSATARCHCCPFPHAEMAAL